MSKEINCVYVITYTGDPETNVEGWIADEKDFSIIFICSIPITSELT